MQREVLGLLEDTMGTLSVGDREALAISLGRAPRGDMAPATFRKRLQRATERLRVAWRETHGR